ncbi:MASE1 domain-containing protein [Phytomonospora sp. NPDC050363]|uniref:MASE1 domain-containing protein n=1 Tax=Phytomonospora sp. NPDC050363 TaxID=3155642 RepID=UPI0033F02751
MAAHGRRRRLPPPLRRVPLTLLFAVFPFLIWAALRFQQILAAPCALLASVIAVYGAVRQLGPLADHDLLGNMVTLQIFNATAALTALLPAAVTAERDQAHRDVQRAYQQLARVVASLRAQP